MVADRRNLGPKPESPRSRETAAARPAAAWSFHKTALNLQAKSGRDAAAEKGTGARRFSIILWDEPEQRRTKRRPDKG